MPGRCATLATCCERLVLANVRHHALVGIDDPVDAHVAVTRNAPAIGIDLFKFHSFVSS